MPIGTPTSMGSSFDNAAGTSKTHSTTATAPASSLIIAVCTWGNATDVTGTMSGGSLTWTTDQSNVNAASFKHRIGIFSAPAAGGLVSGTTLTLTLSGSNSGSDIAICYVTGLDLTGTRKDTSSGAANNGTGTQTWTSGASSTTNADDLLIGGSVIDSSTASTPTAGTTELFDFVATDNAWTHTVTYKIIAATGSQSLSGTWGAFAPGVSAFAAYKMDTGGGGGGTTVKQLAALGVG